MKKLFNLEGKVAIVTGGNGGIGKGIARGFAGMGVSVVIAARNSSKTAQAEQELKKEFNGRVMAVQVDVSQEAQTLSMAEKVIAEFGRIDILVNNAGVNTRKMPQDYDVSEWDAIINTNLRGAFLCSRAVYPSMKKAGGGKIINIGSMNSIFGGMKLAPYGASKGGVVQMARSLATTWAPDNIQVNSLLPGWINTELIQQARQDLPGLEERVLSRTPAGRWGEPQDLVGAAIFLASSASDFITGVALPVDGGFSMML
jgi:2-dehydro-3-deoxy-D-gluconate 5-dehydrogenase